MGTEAHFLLVRNPIKSALNKTIPQESLAIIEAICTEFNCAFVDYSIRGHERRMILDLFIDSKHDVTIDLCTSVNRAIVEASATDKFLGNVYTLEVSSPGVDRPLKFNWQYTKHVGRLLSVTTLQGDVAFGRLLSTNGDSIILALVDKKKKIQEEKEIAFAEIAKAVVEIEF